MSWYKLTETPCLLLSREMEVEVTLRKKKILAVCGMMTFNPKYSFESPFANIWENNLFDSDSLSFDLI